MYGSGVKRPRSGEEGQSGHGSKRIRQPQHGGQPPIPPPPPTQGQAGTSQQSPASAGPPPYQPQSPGHLVPGAGVAGTPNSPHGEAAGQVAPPPAGLAQQMPMAQMVAMPQMVVGPNGTAVVPIAAPRMAGTSMMPNQYPPAPNQYPPVMAPGGMQPPAPGMPGGAPPGAGGVYPDPHMMPPGQYAQGVDPYAQQVVFPDPHTMPPGQYPPAVDPYAQQQLVWVPSQHMVPNDPSAQVQTQVCVIHGKKRTLQNLRVNQLGQWQCSEATMCKDYRTMQNGGQGARGQYVCSVHGKHRSEGYVRSTGVDDNGNTLWVCLPGRECK